MRAAQSENLHRTLNVAASRLQDILCHREQRYVGAQLTISYDRKQIIQERNELTEELADKYVELYDFFDRPLEVRWKCVALPCRVFSKDQRVTHTAIVENKRLDQALALVMAALSLLLQMGSWRRRASSLEAWAALQVYQREQLRSAKIFKSSERSHHTLPLHFT